MINYELKLRNYIAISIIFLITGSQAMAQRQMENLDRGVIAIHKGNDSVYIGWRMLGTGMKKAPKPNIMVLPLQVHRK